MHQEGDVRVGTVGKRKRTPVVRVTESWEGTPEWIGSSGQTSGVKVSVGVIPNPEVVSRNRPVLSRLTSQVYRVRRFVLIL